MKCSKCGAGLTPLGKFCFKCGTIIRKVDHTHTIKEPIAPKRHVGVMILITAVAFVLLINISVALLLIRNGSKSADDGETVGTHRTWESTSASGSTGESTLSNANTQEKSAYGDMNYVSITQPSDNYGNFLADGTG